MTISLIDPRISMVPAGAVTDERLGEVELRVLIAFGAYNENNGWAAPDWPVLARALGFPKEELHEATATLVKLGFVRQKLIKKGRVAIYAVTHNQAYAKDRGPEPGIDFGLRDYVLLDENGGWPYVG